MLIVVNGYKYIDAIYLGLFKFFSKKIFFLCLQVVVLFYHLPTLNQPFQYDLGTFCTQTFDLGATMITCNKSVRPYTAFDPRYKSSRIAIVNYSDDISGIKNSLVLYCL